MANPLIPFLARHCLAGMAAGWIFMGGLLGLDVGNLRTLIFAEQAWWLPLGLLLFGVSVTFGSAAMGAGIMGLGRSDPPGGRQSESSSPNWLGMFAPPHTRRAVPIRARS
jgi:hypothetical protein